MEQLAFFFSETSKAEGLLVMSTAVTYRYTRLVIDLCKAHGTTVSIIKKMDTAC